MVWRNSEKIAVMIIMVAAWAVCGFLITLGLLPVTAYIGLAVAKSDTVTTGAIVFVFLMGGSIASYLLSRQMLLSNFTKTFTYICASLLPVIIFILVPEFFDSEDSGSINPYLLIASFLLFPGLGFMLAVPRAARVSNEDCRYHQQMNIACNDAYIFRRIAAQCINFILAIILLLPGTAISGLIFSMGAERSLLSSCISFYSWAGLFSLVILWPSLKKGQSPGKKLCGLMIRRGDAGDDVGMRLSEYIVLLSMSISGTLLLGLGLWPIFRDSQRCILYEKVVSVVTGRTEEATSSP